ncbi:MAG: amino acid adenylation domain protein, partial [Burkholderiales bacterium]|nr:amino acid adenylation domain protein [Burkholderiales bacterium]
MRYTQNAGKYLQDKTIHLLFEEQAAKTPNNIAVVYEDTKLTYQELNQKANQLANYLQKTYNIKGDDLIALCLDRSEYMLIAILGVLKSGGAYVPIDLGYPKDRINFILSDTKAKVLLVNSGFDETKVESGQYEEDFYRKSDLAILAIDSNAFLETLKIYPKTNPKQMITNINLAYVIYTSGTTGKPKGVMVEHRQLFYFTLGFIKSVLDTKNKQLNCLSTTHYVFDIFGLEYIVPLINGCYVELINLNKFINLSCKIDISKYGFIQLTPSKVRLFLNQVIRLKKRKTINVLIGGEALSQSEVNLIFEYEQNNKNIRFNIINVYGPTETTIWSTYKKINKTDIISIGTALPNETTYILDNVLSPVPLGEIGELYIGGSGVARGYLNQPELTRKSFLANPFQTYAEIISNTNTRLYKTGDLARMLPDGNIEYIGRHDLQVKIRGYRVELSEIEHVMHECPDIAKSVVIAKLNESTQQYSLFAYYTVKDIVGNGSVIQDWLDVYEKEYSENFSADNYKLNINVWKNSFTDTTIPKYEMIEWVNETNKRIKEISCGKILEIGCGSGLILFNIIDDTDYYYATDFSKEVITNINKISKEHGLSDKVETITSPADKLPFEQLKYNTTIINSVTQHFPNLCYLEDLIARIVENTEEEGIIFIGDVRDFRLLEVFHYAVATYKYKDASVAEIKKNARYENELLISPDYFINLGYKLKGIANVDILAKHGQFDNEMNKFRYDVVIYINKKHIPKVSKKIIFTDTINIQEYLETNSKDSLFIRYPNKRVYANYSKWIAISSQHNKIISDCKFEPISYSLEQKDILSVDEIVAFTEGKGYVVKIMLDLNSPDSLLIILTKTKNQYFSSDFTYSNNFNGLYANNPAVLSYIQGSNLEQKIYDALKDKLPEYMIPNTLIYLDKFPLTVNGKLDRHALSDMAVIGISSKYINPRNELDKSLINIFSKVLGLSKDKLSIDADFFRLGGNSILAIKLVNQLNKQIPNAKVSVADI